MSNIKNEYLQFAQRFLKEKLYILNKKNVKKDFDVVKFEEKLIDANIKNFTELHNKTKEIARAGLTQISQPSIAIKNFYKYLDNKIDNIVQIDTNLVSDYVNKECINNGLGLGTRTNYRNSIVDFINFTENNSVYKFNLEKIRVISATKDKKNKSKLIDWIDKNQLSFLNTEILKYNHRDDFTKCRNILIIRLFMFSGIEPNEMTRLKEDNFIFEDGEMYLRIDKTASREERTIPLPKGKFVVYFNKYIEEKKSKSSSKYFFFNDKNTSESISTLSLKYITKELIDFTGIKVKDKTPSMLRKSFAIILNNEKDPVTGLTQPEKNIQYLLGVQNLSRLRQLLKFSTISVVQSSRVFDEVMGN
ncbi:MAG: site-specific integrase [Campylobacterota bacterium]|nr:site-specific integrase [Campylobacterota bacterium]